MRLMRKRIQHLANLMWRLMPRVGGSKLLGVIQDLKRFLRTRKGKDMVQIKNEVEKYLLETAQDPEVAVDLIC